MTAILETTDAVAAVDARAELVRLRARVDLLQRALATQPECPCMSCVQIRAWPPAVSR